MRLEGIEPSFSVPKTDALSVELQTQFYGIIIPQMADFNEQIENIQKEIRETPHHKGTEHHIGILRARIARLKDKLMDSEQKSGGGGGGGYSVKKQGDATIVLVGPPSVGKSTLINMLTNANSKIAPYAFTTLTVIPGMMNYKDAKIQILDVPGLIEGAEEGKGRGKEVLSVVRGSDLIIIMTEPEKVSAYDSILEALERNGIRINKNKPKVKIEKRISGGLSIFTNIKQEISKESIKGIAMEMGLKNGDITINEKVSIEELIDSFSKNRVYIPAIFVINKADTLDPTKKYHLESEYNINPIFLSAEKNEYISTLVEAIWDKLSFIRVYLVKKDEEPSSNSPIIIKKRTTLNEIALKIGPKFAENIKSAIIWGEGSKFPGQEVSLSTEAKDLMKIRFV